VFSNLLQGEEILYVQQLAPLVTPDNSVCDGSMRQSAQHQ